MTSFTPRKPRSASERRNAVQNGSASDAPVATPSTSRRPSVFTPTAIITATETMRPAWRDFRYVASIHRYGQAPSMGRARSAILSSVLVVSWFRFKRRNSNPNRRPAVTAPGVRCAQQAFTHALSGSVLHHARGHYADKSAGLEAVVPGQVEQGSVVDHQALGILAGDGRL